MAALTVDALLHLHAAASLGKQLHLGDLVGERSWQVDLGEGRISFGDDLSYATVRREGAVRIGETPAGTARATIDELGRLTKLEFTVEAP